jgi:hypothetical protein
MIKFKGEFKENRIEIFNYNFQIEKNINEISIELISKTFEHFFLIIKDPTNKIRALFTYKTRIKKYILSENINLYSNSTLSTPIIHGKWNITLIKPYNIKGKFLIQICPTERQKYFNLKNNFIQINNLNKIYNNDAKWYKGDLHIHSYYSDGRKSLEDIEKLSTENKLDYIAITDHNIISNLQSKNSKILNILSTELTFDNEGHINIYGLKKFIDYSKYFYENNYSHKNKIINQILDNCSKKSSLISINHCFHPGCTFNHDISLKNINFLEVINSPKEDIEFDYNEKCIKFLDFLWKKKYLIYGIGGSDFHNSHFGSSINYIYAKYLSENSLLNSMKNGNIYISLIGDIEFSIIDNKGNNILPGNFVKGNIKYKISSNKKLIWNLIKNGNILKTIKDTNSIFNIEIKKNDFIRVEGRELFTNKIKVFINPIHYIKNTNERNSWKKLIKEFEQIGG